MKTARRFRWHRGLLVDSMETTASVVSVEDFLGLVSGGFLFDGQVIGSVRD